jgi:hypothetical protein
VLDPGEESTDRGGGEIGGVGGAEDLLEGEGCLGLRCGRGRGRQQGGGDGCEEAKLKTHPMRIRERADGQSWEEAVSV